MTLHDTLTDTRPSWHNPRILALLLLVFLCGLACGVCAARIAFSRMTARGAVSWKESGRASTMAHLKQDLDLTPDQAQQIEVLLDDLAKYYDNLQGQMDDFRQDGKMCIRDSRRGSATDARSPGDAGENSDRANAVAGC